MRWGAIFSHRRDGFRHHRIRSQRPGACGLQRLRLLRWGHCSQAKLAKEHPLGRVGEAEDSAALAYFLLSNDASWVTGQIIGVDGGRSAVA